ncbi:eukaryotic translation initiation factor 3 subunit A [Phyllostomus discolor]|uniref:Eukaryotic translation initiation factor 3 subunit A n=1 Tax=Phyllostomus discolor TaxID=89673 RepID=A0A834A5G5_9CHIR|nr:eukaryotic translation initiation factor 3 subunit A [Phyllostomus discolor]
MTETAGGLLSDQSGKKQVPGDVLMTGRMTGQKSGIRLVVCLRQPFPETGKETETERETEKEKGRRRRPRGELRKIGSLFVVLRTRLMRMGGLQCDVKSQSDGLRLLSHVGLVPSKDYYTCASTNLNWIR